MAQTVFASFDSVNQAVDKARSGGGPTLIEAKTYRFHGHHVGDAQTHIAPAMKPNGGAPIKTPLSFSATIWLITE